MPITPEQVEEYFKQLDWPFIRKDERLWDSGYNGNNYRFRFFVRVVESWMYVTWLFPIAIRDECRANIYEHCLRMGYTMNGAKVMLDNDIDLTLTVEYPADNVSVEEFESALRNVCWNVDKFFMEMARLATDPNAVSSLRPPPPAAGGSSGGATGGSSGSSGSSGTPPATGGTTGGDVDWGTGTGTPPTPGTDPSPGPAPTGGQ